METRSIGCRIRGDWLCHLVSLFNMLSPNHSLCSSKIRLTAEASSGDNSAENSPRSLYRKLKQSQKSE